MSDSDLGFICYIHELQKTTVRDFIEYIYAHCLFCSTIQLFDCLLLTSYFLLLDKSNMITWWMMFPKIIILYVWIQCPAGAVDCRVYIVASPWTKLIFSDPRNLVGRFRYKYGYLCIYIDHACGTDHQYLLHILHRFFITWTNLRGDHVWRRKQTYRPLF